MVLYRKYRPQTIEELDLEKVRTRLTSILESKEIPHAFLFTGPKGLGKTSSARILAKAITCREKKGIEPCNACSSCEAITKGSHIDVIEIDAASNRGIDEIRDLRERVKYAPAELSKKIYIIDEVHMLTNDAFNALLKTLEEPPEHVVFILCTTELWKVLPTIVSRTFQVEFEKPTKDEAIRSLTRVVNGEKLQVSSHVLEQIYSLSEGSFRDGTKILEELSMSAKNGPITIATLDAAFSSSSLDQEAERLIEFLSAKEGKKALQLVEALAKKGCDFRIVTEKILDSLREYMLMQSGVKPSLRQTSLSLDQIQKLVEMLTHVYKNTKISPVPQLPLESAIVQWCNSGDSLNPMQVKKVSAKSPESKQLRGESSRAKDAKSGEESVDDNKKTDLFEANLPENFLTALIENVKKDNHSIAGVLRGCKMTMLTDSEMHFQTSFKFHYDKLKEPKVREIIEKRAKELLNRTITFKIETVKATS